MRNPPTRLALVSCLTLAGLLSSLLILSPLAYVLSHLQFFGVGLMFGMFLAACFRFRFGVRSPWKLWGFVVASTAAYPLAVYCYIPPGPLSVITLPYQVIGLRIYNWLGFAHAPRGQTDPITLFGSGAIGAFVVLAAGLFAISSQAGQGWRTLLKAYLWALVGGALGVFGYALGPSLGLNIWRTFQTLANSLGGAQTRFVPSSDDLGFYSLYPVWQTGVALLLGLLWWAGETAVPACVPAEQPAETTPARTASERLPLTARVFFVATALLAFFFAGRTAWTSYTAARTYRAIALSNAEAPSRLNLPAPKPLSIDQALILGSVAGHVTLASDVSYVPNAAVAVPCMHYYASYAPASISVNAAAPPDVRVELNEYPNAAWATYQLRNLPVPNAAFWYTKYRKKVNKFGNWIISDSGRQKTGGELLILWSSGPMLVSMHFRTVEEDAFLQAYLKKYPSDLRQ